MPQNQNAVEKNQPIAAPSRVRATLLRVGVAGGMALAFVGAASLLEPGSSRAGENGTAITLPDGVSRGMPEAFYQVDSTSDLGRSLGEIKGRRYRVEIVAGRNGEDPTYRVLDADGHIIADRLHADQAYTVDEDLTIDRMGDYPAAPSEQVMGPLMLLETGRE